MLLLLGQLNNINEHASLLSLLVMSKLASHHWSPHKPVKSRQIVKTNRPNGFMFFINFQKFFVIITLSSQLIQGVILELRPIFKVILWLAKTSYIQSTHHFGKLWVFVTNVIFFNFAQKFIFTEYRCYFWSTFFPI